MRVCVSLAELLLRTVMGQDPALEYMMLGACGLLWPCLIIAR
jgi:hypothetical protein